MTTAVELLVSLTEAALSAGASVLTEPEVYRVLDAAGLVVPQHVVLPLPASVTGTEARFPEVPTGQVVLKVVSRDILHKSDVGAVRFLEGHEVTPHLVSAFVEDASRRWANAHGRLPTIQGALIMKRVAFDAARPSSEVIVGLRFSRDFGFVGLIGLGGLKAELFGERLPRRDAAALFSPTTPAAAMWSCGTHWSTETSPGTCEGVRAVSRMRRGRSSSPSSARSPRCWPPSASRGRQHSRSSSSTRSWWTRPAGWSPSMGWRG